MARHPILNGFLIVLVSFERVTQTAVGNAMKSALPAQDLCGKATPDCPYPRNVGKCYLKHNFPNSKIKSSPGFQFGKVTECQNGGATTDPCPKSKDCHMAFPKEEFSQFLNNDDSVNCKNRKCLFRSESMVALTSNICFNSVGKFCINNQMNVDANNIDRTFEAKFSCSASGKMELSFKSAITGEMQNIDNIDTVYCGECFQPSNSQFWLEEGQRSLREALEKGKVKKRAKNVILFLGDGLGVTVNTAFRIYKGQKENLPSDQDPLVWEKFPNSALSKANECGWKVKMFQVYSFDMHTPDSGSTMTSILSGVKAKQLTIGVGPEAEAEKCDSTSRQHWTDNIFSWAINDGNKWAGIVTDTRITHATPASAYAHSPARFWENDDQTPDGINCPDIARQLIELSPGKDLRVILGGGRQHLMPEEKEDLEPFFNTETGQTETVFGKRKDGRDLIQEWRDLREGNNEKAAFIFNKEQLNEVNPEDTDFLLGLFDYSHLEFRVVHDALGRTDNPTLTEMTRKAIQILSKSPDGFLLTVEGGMIDFGLHLNRAALAFEEALDFHNAVEEALKLTDESETLIIVTADHSHVMTIGGFPSRSTSILGKISGNADVFAPTDGKPDTILNFANGPSGLLRNGIDRRDLTNVDTENLQFQHPAFVPTERETHGGEDVAIYAKGPYSHLLCGAHENTYIAHVMSFAMCVGPARPLCNVEH